MNSAPHAPEATQALSVAGDRLKGRIDRLTELSRAHHRSAFARFEWLDARELEGHWWMSPQLLTLAGTDHLAAIDAETARALSRWEIINLFSLNVHGIRELCLEVTQRLYGGCLHDSEVYLHHFLEEENQHMWYFAEFCRRYGGKIYHNKKTRIASARTPAIQTFLAFARIFVFEEVGDYFNAAVAADPSVHPLVRDINQAHHEDESRHIAFGRALLARQAELIHQNHSRGDICALSKSLVDFIDLTLTSLYNPSAYRDAGLQNALALRNALIVHPKRRQLHRHIVRRITKLFSECELVSQEHLRESNIL